MSWLYLPEVGGGNMPVSTSSDGEPFATSKSRATRARSSKRGSVMASSTMPPSGMTSTPSMEDHGAELWISSLRASLVNRIRPLEIDWAAMTIEISGLKRNGSLAKWDHASRSWKTSSASYHLDTSSEFSEIYTRSGIQLRGTLSRLPPLVRHMRDVVSGLLPTPTATDGKRTYSSIETHWSLSDALGGFPHPATHEWMMGWPIGATDLRPLAMDGFQVWLRWHGATFGEECLYEPVEAVTADQESEIQTP